MSAPDNTRTPIRNACSLPTTRVRSRCLLHVGGFADLARNELVEIARRRQRPQRPRIEHGVEQSPPARKNARQSRRRAHDIGHQPQQSGIGFEQREQLNTGRQFRHETDRSCVKARSGSAVRASSAMSSGCTSVSRSRALGERTAG